MIWLKKVFSLAIYMLQEQEQFAHGSRDALYSADSRAKYCETSEQSKSFTVSNVFADKKYKSNFFYGGDGYFDNMNSYFGGNGFTIYDRGRGSVLSDKIKTERHNIDDNEVTFENAWGICDEDIYSKMLKVADEHYAEKVPFSIS